MAQKAHHQRALKFLRALSQNDGILRRDFHILMYGKHIIGSSPQAGWLVDRMWAELKGDRYYMTKLGRKELEKLEVIESNK